MTCSAPLIDMSPLADVKGFKRIFCNNNKLMCLKKTATTRDFYFKMRLFIMYTYTMKCMSSKQKSNPDIEKLTPLSEENIYYIEYSFFYSIV